MSPTRDENRLLQRRRILDSARALFADRGVDAVTVSEVADGAGVARATVFNHFASKHALIDAITSEVLAYWAGMLDKALQDEETPTPTLLRSLFDWMGLGIEQYHAFYRGVFREIARLTMALEEGSEADAVRLVAFDRLTKLVARGIERGDLAAQHDPVDIAAAVHSLSNGTITHWLYEDASDSLRARMRRAMEMLLGGIAVEDASARHLPLTDLAPQLDSPSPAGEEQVANPPEPGAQS
jgi:AcrR family transcriptional regulator